MYFEYFIIITWWFWVPFIIKWLRFIIYYKIVKWLYDIQINKYYSNLLKIETELKLHISSIFNRFSICLNNFKLLQNYKNISWPYVSSDSQASFYLSLINNILV